MVVIFLGGFFSVDAMEEQIYVGDKIPGIYIRKIASDGTETVKQGGFIRRASDNKVVYCLEPFVLINTEDYVGYEDFTVLNISKDTWDKVTLIAYYGYQYKDHTADYWYYVTQMLIWRTVDPSSQFYFTNTLGGSNDETLFQREIAEIEDLVSKHNVVPNIDNISLMYGETAIIEDSNNVLSEYKVIGSSKASIVGNTLVINADNLEDEKIILERINDNYENLPIIYIASGSQSIMTAGSVSDVKHEISLNIEAAKLKLVKIDAISKDPVKIAGIRFLIYDVNTSQLVYEGVTNNEGILETDYIFKKGQYKIVEDPNQVILGYELNSEEVYFKVNDELDITVQFLNKPVLGGIKILKTNEETLPLQGCVFGLYKLDGTLVDILKTDENGEAYISNLREGKYNLKELETIDGYILDQNVYEIELKLEDNKIALVEKSLINYKEKGAIEIIKVDENAQVLAGAEFALYNEDMEEVTTATTDDTGRIYIGNLSLGKYFLREVKAPEGYQLIDELIALEIKNDMEVITVKVTNDSIDIAVPDTQIEFKIDKYILKKKKISL